MPKPPPHKTPAPAERPVRKEKENLSRIAGLSAVSALFAASPERVERLFFDDKMKAKAGDFSKQMAKARKPYRLVTGEELAKISGTAMHGGIVAVAQAREAKVFDARLAKDWAQDGKPLLILDGISNPHNLGAIARTAAFFGIPRMVISDHPMQTKLSDASYRVAEGGLDQIEVYQATKFSAALKQLREHYCVLAAAPGEHIPLHDLKRERMPYALVMGNEEDGLPQTTMKACDKIVSIPGGGKIQSLNVSASTAILLYALSDLA